MPGAQESGHGPALHRAVAAGAVLDDRIGARWGISGSDLAREETVLLYAAQGVPEDNQVRADLVAEVRRERSARGWTEEGTPAIHGAAVTAASVGRQAEVLRDEATGQVRVTGTTSTSGSRVSLDDPEMTAQWLRTTPETAESLVQSGLQRSEQSGQPALLVDDRTDLDSIDQGSYGAVLIVDPDAQAAASAAYDSASEAARTATVTADGGDDAYAGVGLEDARDALAAAQPRAVRTRAVGSRAAQPTARLPQAAHGLAHQAQERNDTRQRDVSRNARQVVQEASAREATYAHHRYDKPRTTTPQIGQDTP